MTKKGNIYKILLILGFSIYLLFSILVVQGAITTYQSISYNFFNFGSFSNLGIFDYFRISYYFLFLSNLVIIIKIVKMIINNRYSKIVFAFYCIIHFVMCILYYINYDCNDIMFLIIGCMIPIILSIFLYRKYIENIVNNK